MPKSRGRLRNRSNQRHQSTGVPDPAALPLSQSVGFSPRHNVRFAVSDAFGFVRRKGTEFLERIRRVEKKGMGSQERPGGLPVFRWNPRKDPAQPSATDIRRAAR